MGRGFGFAFCVNWEKRVLFGNMVIKDRIFLPNSGIVREVKRPFVQICKIFTVNT
jgi:hypothetical protein